MYIPWDRQDCEFNDNRKEACLPSFQITAVAFATFVLLIIGFIACVAVYKLERIRNKAIVLYITGFVYFAFVIMMGYYCSQGTKGNDWLIIQSPNSFMIEIYYVAMPLISVIFMGLPFILTFEIMFFAALAFLVLVPLFNETGSNLWLQFDDTSVYEHFISYIIVYAYDRPVYDFIVRTVPISGAKEFASNIYSRCTDPEMKEDHCIDMAR